MSAHRTSKPRNPRQATVFDNEPIYDSGLLLLKPNYPAMSKVQRPKQHNNHHPLFEQTTGDRGAGHSRRQRRQRCHSAERSTADVQLVEHKAMGEFASAFWSHSTRSTAVVSAGD